jgi:hypothetical protein
MMFKLTRKLATKLAAPSAFAMPSIMNDSPKVRAKFRRNFEEHALVAVKYLMTSPRDGKANTPKQERNARIRAEWKEAPHKNMNRFAREYCDRHPEEGQDPKAHRKVRGQLKRLLKDERREAEEGAEREQEFREAVRSRVVW